MTSPEEGISKSGHFWLIVLLEIENTNRNSYPLGVFLGNQYKIETPSGLQFELEKDFTRFKKDMGSGYIYFPFGPFEDSVSPLSSVRRTFVFQLPKKLLDTNSDLYFSYYPFTNSKQDYTVRIKSSGSYSIKNSLTAISKLSW